MKFISPLKKAERQDLYLLYEFLSLKAQFLSAEHNDIQRFIYLFPSNPNPLVALVTSKALEYSTFPSETDKRIVTKVLEALVDLKFEYCEITYLFIATCMLTSDKTVRSFASELWINGINEKKIESTEIGRIIGTHISGGYAPMKRLTDLIAGSLLKVTPAHNKALEEMLTSIVENIHVDPPVGSKRLLELYCEMLLLNSSTLRSDKARAKISSWAKSPTLKKLSDKILSEA